LGADIAPSRVDVPASNATGTGINALDLQDDFDSPNARVVELTSNADGDKKKIPWKPILIGVGIGAVVIATIIVLKKKGKK